MKKSRIEIVKTEVRIAGKPRDKRVYKEPSAIIYLTLEIPEEDEKTEKGELSVQIAGSPHHLLNMFEKFTKHLMKLLGDELIVAVFRNVFASKFDEMMEKARLATKVHEKKTKKSKSKSNGELIN